jgi:hypothetical protein
LHTSSIWKNRQANKVKTKVTGEDVSVYEARKLLASTNFGGINLLERPSRVVIPTRSESNDEGMSHTAPLEPRTRQDSAGVHQTKDRERHAQRHEHTGDGAVQA